MADTKSRYDFMRDGNTVDEVLNSSYPDPLSLNYHKLALSDLPKKDKMTGTKIAYFWKETENIYGAPVYDDVVLTLNGVPHKNLLQEGDEVFFPSVNDIEYSYQLRQE